MKKMDFLDHFNDDERVPPRPDRWAIIDRINPLNEFDEIHFPDRFHMYKQNVADIIILLEPRLSCHSLRGMPIPPYLQILITLRFLACGTFHCETGDLCGVSEPKVCKIVHKVCNAICKLKDDYIKFRDAATQAIYKVQFYEYGNFPGVIGCIDGCHIPIKRLSTPDAEEYRNRKNWFSINVQGVCTPTMQFSNIVACWKGATHDSRIFQNSSLYAHLEGGQHSGIILGDSGKKLLYCDNCCSSASKKNGWPDPEMKDDNDLDIPIVEANKSPMSSVSGLSGVPPPVLKCSLRATAFVFFN